MFPACTASAEAPSAQRPYLLQAVFADDNYTIADAFVNEELVYDIGFWFFDDVAVGRLDLRKGEGNDYVATLKANTTGQVVNWVLRHRKDTYVAHFKMAGDGKRFITKSFEKTVNIGGKVRRTKTVFDFGKNVMTWKSWQDGREDKSGETPLPRGIYCDDPLAAFYNFRFGVYGPIEEGREYRIYSFPKQERVPEIYLKVLKKDDMLKRGNNAYSADYLADVKLDKDLFGSKAGDVEIYFTRDMTPVEAVAREILFFGDVRGRLTQIGINMGFEKKGAVHGAIQPVSEDAGEP